MATSFPKTVAVVAMPRLIVIAIAISNVSERDKRRRKLHARHWCVPASDIKCSDE
jgi:hypothetical protein